MTKRFWLWVWDKGNTRKNGWDFDTKEQAEAFFNWNYKSTGYDAVEHEITEGLPERILK